MSDSLFEEQLELAANATPATQRTPYIKEGDYVLEVIAFWASKKNDYWGVEAKVIEAAETAGPASKVGSNVSISLGVGADYPESAHKSFMRLVMAVSRMSFEQLTADKDVYKKALREVFSEKNTFKGRKFRVVAYKKEGKNFTHYNFNPFVA